MFIASRFVWSIEFDGNYVYTDDAMLRFLNEHGISTGDKVKSIDTESIEKAIKMNCRRLHGLMQELREIF